MDVTIDISRVAAELGTLHHAGGSHQSIAVVVPLAPGRAEVVRELFFSEGPPFDPAAIGLREHKVFLTDREAVFVFETDEGVAAFERILAQPDFLELVAAWRRSMADEPRIATAVFEWPAHAR